MQKEDCQKALAQRVREMLQLIELNGAPSLSEYRLAREMIAYLECEGVISASRASAWQEILKDDFLHVA